MIRRGSANKQTSFVSAPAQNDVLTGKEGIVKTAAPENLGAVYESTNFEVDLSGQLTTRKALRPALSEAIGSTSHDALAAGLQLFDGYVLTKAASTGDYGINHNALKTGDATIYVTYVDYDTLEEAPEIPLNDVKDAVILDDADVTVSGSAAYLSSVVIYASKWTPSTKPFSDDVSGEIVRLATLRMAEDSESKWILRIITPEVAIPEDASDGNGFDPNLYGDVPYAMRDAYGYGSTSVRGILAYKAYAPLIGAPTELSYTFPLNGANTLFHCVAGNGYLYIYANHAFSKLRPTQLRDGTHTETGLSVYFTATYADASTLEVKHAAPMLYVPKGALLAKVRLATDASSALSSVSVRFGANASSGESTAVCTLPDDRDFAECPDSESMLMHVADIGATIATKPSGDEGWDAEYTLERFGLSIGADDTTCTLAHRTPSLYKDTRALDTLGITVSSSDGRTSTASVVRYSDVSHTLPQYATCAVSATASESWKYAYQYAKDTTVQDLMEFKHLSGYGMLSSLRASDFSNAYDVLVLKALMTFSDTPKERYMYWERSLDGANWEPVPEFLLRLSAPGRLRYIRVTDATSSNETLENADSYAKYVLACPIYGKPAQSDVLLNRPDVLIIPQRSVKNAVLYKYRVVCVERAGLDGLTPTANATQPIVLYRSLDGVSLRVPCYKEGPVVYLDSAFPSAELSLRYLRGSTSLSTASCMSELEDLSKSPSAGTQNPTFTLTLDAADFTRTSRLFAVRQANDATYAQTLEATVMRCTSNMLTLNTAPTLNADCKGASTGGVATLNYAYAASLRNRTDFPVNLCDVEWEGEELQFAPYSASSDKYGFGYDTYSPTEQTSHVSGTTLTLSANGTSDSTTVTLMHSVNTHVSPNEYFSAINPIYIINDLKLSDGRLLCRASEEGSVALTCITSYGVGFDDASKTLTVDASTLNYAVRDTVNVSLRGCAFARNLKLSELPRSTPSEYYKTYVPGKALRRISIWQPTQTSIAFGPYSFDLGTSTDTLSTDNLYVGMCKIVEHNEVFLAYGGFAKNKVYVSEAGTMIFPNSLAVESRSGADVTGLLKWRSHVIMTTKSSIELLTYNSDSGTYAIRTLSATMGVSEDDANAMQALPNSFILRSGDAVYSLSPSMYSGSDELLYTNLISARLGDALSGKPAICSWIDRSANAYHMLCKGNVDFVYDYTRKMWWRNVYTPSVKNAVYISGEPYLACEFKEDSFGTVLYTYTPKLSKTSGTRYVDAYWTGTPDRPILTESRIPLSVTWRDKCSKPTLDKQYLELKYTITRHNGLKHVSDACSIGVGGELLKRTLDPNATMPFATSESAYASGLGALSANAFQTSGETVGGQMDQMFVKFSGRGKTATLTIEPTSDDRITLHSAELRWRTLPNKQ
ncbi:hypothetical protein [Paratractidigestivibacter sp.]|uniref:hypothetical protein n=1 Tax=Paratractidigestivibacter sp. TaxID=2847316 RepID=UPI002AC92F3D|nr:hypothetical protein [Paratractidigestivibacter sp.]